MQTLSQFPRDPSDRSAPRCYSRRGAAVAVEQPRAAEADSTIVLLILSVATCAAAFALVYGGWSF